MLGNSDRGSLIGGFRSIDLQGLPDDYLSTYVARVEAVTPEGVSKLASEYLKTDDMILVVVGDLKSVKPQLEKLKWMNPADLN